MRKTIILSLIFTIITSQLLFADNTNNLLSSLSLFGNSEKIQMEVKMSIKSGSTDKNRTLSVYIQKDDTVTKTLLHIIKPGFLSKMKFLSHISKTKKDLFWLKTSRGTKRVSSSEKTSSLFDSDFTIEDLMDINTEDYTLEIADDQEEIQNIQCDILILTPKKKTYYASKVFYINNGFIWGIDYYSTDSILIKTYRVNETQDISGQIIPKLSVMKNHIKDTETVLDFHKVDFSPSFSSRIFNKASL